MELPARIVKEGEIVRTPADHGVTITINRQTIDRFKASIEKVRQATAHLNYKSLPRRMRPWDSRDFDVDIVSNDDNG